MGYNVKFENGYSVTFDTQPTEADIEDAYAQITKNVTKSNELKAGGKAAVEATLPTLGGLATGIKTAAHVGSKTIPTLGPWVGGAAALGAGTIAGIGGSTAVNAVQDFATSFVPEQYKEKLGFGKQQRASEREQYPISTFVGEQLPSLLAFKPGFAAPIMSPAGRVAVSPAAQHIAMGGLGAGMEAGTQLLRGEELDPTKIGIAGAFNAALTNPTRLGQRIIGGIGTVKGKPTIADELKEKQGVLDKTRELLPELAPLRAKEEEFQAKWKPLSESKETPMQQMARELNGEPFAPAEEFTPMSQMAKDLTAERSTPAQRAAQDILDERQKQMEFDVARQARPELSAAELQRREAAPTGYKEHLAAQEEAAKVERQARDSELAKAAGAGEQASLFEPHTNMHRAYEEVFAQTPEGVRPFSFNEFKETLQNLAKEPGTAFKLPEDMKTAYQDYLNHPGGGQGDLFGAHEVLQSTSHKTWGELSPQEKASATRALNKIGPISEHLQNRMKAEETQRAQMDTLKGATADLVDALVHSAGGSLNLMPGQPLGEALRKFIVALGDIGYTGLKEAVSAAQRLLKDSWNLIADKFATIYESVVGQGQHYLAGTTIPKDSDVGKTVEAAREQNDSKFIKGLQSGSTLTAMKTGSIAIRESSRAMQNGMKRIDLAIRNFVFPAEKALVRLPAQELTDLHQVMKDEMLKGQRYDPELLASTLTEKQLQAYVKMREMFDSTLATQNAARVAKGLKPIAAHEAYMSSRWQGAFRLGVYDEAGKPVWFLSANSASGVKKQADALRADFPNLKIDTDKISHVKLGNNKSDVETAYSLMIDVLGRDNDAVKQMQAYFENDTSKLAETVRNQARHFEPKTGVRGFVGDRPGFTGHGEAVAGFQEQLTYAKNGIYWSEMQQVGDFVKHIINDPVLRDKQPNNVAYIEEYFRNALGFNQNSVARSLENTLRDTFKVSSQDTANIIGHGKNLFILQKLGGNLAYLTGNILQSSMIIPYLADLRSQGFKGNPAKALTLGLPTGMAMGFGHMAKAQGAEYMNKLPTPFLKEMFLYAEENGITGRSIYEEGKIQSGFSALGTLENVLSKSISVPDMFLHSITFSSMAHMLNDSKVYKDNIKLFQHAEEITNVILADARKQERPLMFSRWGTAGNMMDTLQTFSLNFFNQYGYALKRLSQGSIAPLAAMMGIQYLSAGLKGIPFMEDVYNGYMKFRDLCAAEAPDWWAEQEKSPFWQDPKGWLIDTAGDRAVYGMVSAETGLGLTNRVMAPTMGGMLSAPGGPPTEALKQAWSGAKYAMDTEDPVKRTQAAMNSLPAGLQGVFEMADINEGLTYNRGPNDTKGVYKTSDVGSQQVMYWRTPEEQSMRKFGIKSYKEMVSRDIEYDISKEIQNQELVQGGLVEKATRAAMQGNIKEFDRLNNIYADLTGKPVPVKSILTKGEMKGLSQEERILKRSLNTPSRLVKAIQMENRLQQLQETQ